MVKSRKTFHLKLQQWQHRHHSRDQGHQGVQGVLAVQGDRASPQILFHLCYLEALVVQWDLDVHLIHLFQEVHVDQLGLWDLQGLDYQLHPGVQQHRENLGDLDCQGILDVL